jgi:DNA repair exonuclease SbcCD ATPase subunit
MDSHGSGIQDALKYGTSNATVYTIDALEAYKAEKERILSEVEKITDWTTVDMEELTDKQKELVKEVQDATAAIETAWATLPYSSSKTWESLFKDYEKITERTKTAFSTLHKLTSGDGLSYDEFKNFASILDNINLDAFDPGRVNEYAAAIDRVSTSLYVENGALYMNAEAIKDIASLEQMLAEAEKAEIRTTLLSRKTELETSKAVIEAEIATLEYKLASAKKSADASKKKEAAEDAWAKASTEINKVFDANQAKIATAMVGHFQSAFTEIATKYNQLITGMNGEEISKDTLENFKKEWTEMTKDLNFLSYEKKLDNKSVEDLTYQLEAARKAAESCDFQISNVKLQLALLDSGFRDTAEGTEGAAKALEEYNSKLERFLELLKHIEREQQHLSVAQLFEDNKTGSAAIDALDQQLKYTQHLIKDTKELYQAYEGEASKQAATIRKGFGDMVTFDKWGNYNVDMDKYNAMSDKEKEKLDEWLSVYDGLIDKRDEYYNQHLDYIVDELANNQKRIDKYIDAEDQLVEAIKQREQKILDNKLEAIDKEIEAIEKAADARRKAREEEDASKELSSMQVDLQRALMDSSGASASQILNIQKQIKEKQQEIADDSFDTMVDDMKTQLEEEKKMEKAMFDERLEEMDWYWDEVDRIMSEGTDSVLETMQLYLDDYTEASEIQQTELLKRWTDTFEHALTIGRSGAIKLQSVVSGLQTGINNMVVDEDALTDEAVNTAFEKRPEIKEDKATTSGGGGGGGNWYNNSPQYDPRDEETPKQEESIVKKKYWYDSTKGNQITNGLTKTGAYIAVVNKDGKIARQNIWKDSMGWKYYWKGSQGQYLRFTKDIQEGLTAVQVEGLKDTIRWLKGDIGNLMFCGPKGETYKAFKTGGLADFTGPAWLDGTASQPEAVLNAMQTKAFLSFTDDLAALRAEGGASTSSSITIDNISFNVESMSSVADGEKAFNAFVDKFKEIGAKQGISVLGTANRN